MIVWSFVSQSGALPLKSGECENFFGHLSRQLVDLRMEHQVNGFIGCDYNIELFFKTITQNLQINTLLGTSEHAVMTHMWIALLTYLLWACLRFKSGVGLSCQQRLRLLHINLFDRRNLVDVCHPQPRQASQGQQLYAA
jgi:hypothetical protein